MLALLLPLLEPIVGRLVGMIPDPAAREREKAQAMAAIMAMAQSMDAGQLDVNRTEAASGRLFVAGWRPFVGWVCAAGVAWNWIGLPVALFVLAAAGRSVDLRPADLSEMLPLLFGLLGMGGMRTVEKLNGRARDSLPVASAPSVGAGGARAPPTTQGGQG